jgi:Na+/H+-dicarboxylate symporter/ABC-type amino acid transport substrate-binding protein
MSFSHRILLGLATGVAVGLFLGEYAIVLKWAADGFVKLLQMTVLPYVTLSIVTSLGSLTYAQARTLGLRAGAVLVLLWVVALTFAFLIPLAFPETESAMFFSTSLLERRQPFNFVDLYIPSNPFNSLANNVVPAVVLFSVVVGVALIGVEHKDMLIDVLRTASQAVSRATRSILQLTPYGLFAIAASATGTLSIEQLGRLQVYLVTYVAVGLLFGLWVLPGLIAALTPIRIREMFGLTRDALVTAFVAGDLFIVLPGLIEASRTLLVRHAPGSPQANELPDVLVPTSFNFPHTGKILSLSFILFAGWFADAAVPPSEYPQLAATGLLTFFGSLNAAVPFLLDLFRIPADTFQLFLASGVINSHIGALIAAVHTLAVALLGTCAITGVLRVRRGPLLRYLAITTVLTLVVIGGARVVFIQLLGQQYTRDRVLAGMHLLQQPAPATVLKVRAESTTADSRPVLARMRERGVLRVGYMHDAMPFSFFNEAGDLVGLDVELAHRLATELNVRLEFVPIERSDMAARLSAGDCDVVMAGVAVTTLRAAEMLFTATYLDETIAFVVPDHQRDRFASWQSIRELYPVTIAVPNVPYYIDKLRQRAPRAELRVIDDLSSLFGNWDSQVAAVAIPAERGSVWTLRYPQFAVVVPEPGVIKIPLAYPVPAHDPSFASFMNSWIDLKKKDGTIDTLYDYWVLGRNADPPHPRWSIIRNVLHWVD